MSETKKPETAAPTLNAEVVKMAKEMAQAMLAEAIPAIAVALAAQNKAAAPAVKVRKAACSTCRQEQMACGGQHRKAVVMPRVNPEWFPGIKINGITYISKQDELIDVPADANFEYFLSQWDENETNLQKGKKRVRRSGQIGPGANGVRPLNADDFFR